MLIIFERMRDGFLDAPGGEQILEFVVELFDVLVRWLDEQPQLRALP